MSKLTPGVAFILRGFSRLIVPGGLLLFALGKYTPIPAWVLLLLPPGVIILQFRVRDWKNARRAANLGAQLPFVVPGEWPGNLDILKKSANGFIHGYPGEVQTEFMKASGSYTIDFRILWGNLFFTAEPQHIMALLATDFASFAKGESTAGPIRSVIGTGIFNSDGDMWKFHRALARPYFKKEKISHYDLFDQHADVVLGEMKKRLDEGISVDFQDLVLRFTLDVATEFLFGSCMHSGNAALPYPHNFDRLDPSTLSSDSNDLFSTAVMEAQKSMSERLPLGPLHPLFEIFQDKTAAPVAVLDSFINPIIQEAIRKRNADRAAGEERGEDDEDDTLLASMLRNTSDPVILRDQVLNVMIASRDTTASTMTFIVYLLCQHPDVLAQLRVEILETVGNKGKPTYDDIKDLKYLRAVINETLRLYPAVPFNVRECIQSTTFKPLHPGDKATYIPKGFPVGYSVLIMHRRKDLWGPDAEEFDPDRFLDERLQKYLLPNPTIFLPWNAGPRLCLGQGLAYGEMSFFLIRLLQRFSTMSLDADAQPLSSRPPSEWAGQPGRKGKEQIVPRNHLTLYALGGLWVKMCEDVTP